MISNLRIWRNLKLEFADDGQSAFCKNMLANLLIYTNLTNLRFQ